MFGKDKKKAKTLSVSEKARAYEKCAEQRDAYAHILGNLLYAIRSGCYNNWDISNKRVIGHRSADKVPKFNPEWKDKFNPDTYNNIGAFHISRLIEELHRCSFDLEKIGYEPAEIIDVVKNANIKETVEQLHEDKVFYKKNFKSLDWSYRKMACELYILLTECPIGNGLPNDEPSIYMDAFNALFYAICNKAGVDPTNKQEIIALVKEFYLARFE